MSIKPHETISEWKARVEGHIERINKLTIPLPGICPCQNALTTRIDAMQSQIDELRAQFEAMQGGK